MPLIITLAGYGFGWLTVLVQMALAALTLGACLGLPGRVRRVHAGRFAVKPALHRVLTVVRRL